MTCGVYKIENLANGKVYIGSSVNCQQRWYIHKREIQKGNHHSKHLMSAWAKYGSENFSFVIVEEVSRDLGKTHLLKREQFWLDKFKPHARENGYNTCQFAASPLGTKHSEETRRKISLVQIGIKRSEEHKKKISAAHFGKKKTPQHAIAISRGQSMFVGEKLNELLRLRQLGHSGNEISKIFGCDKSTVNRTLRGHQTCHKGIADPIAPEDRKTGRFVRGAAGKTTKLTIDQMAHALYLFGRRLNNRQISKLTGLTESTVSRMKLKKIITFEEFKSNALPQ